MAIHSPLEVLMLFCFGVAWPVANLRMLRQRRAEGMGTPSTLCILVGYAAGATAKWLSIEQGTTIPVVFWLYVANGVSVGINVALQWHFGRLARTGHFSRRRVRSIRQTLLDSTMSGSEHERRLLRYGSGESGTCLYRSPDDRRCRGAVRPDRRWVQIGRQHRAPFDSYLRDRASATRLGR
jgi:hypothetical protein